MASAGGRLPVVARKGLKGRDAVRRHSFGLDVSRAALGKFDDFLEHALVGIVELDIAAFGDDLGGKQGLARLVGNEFPGLSPRKAGYEPVQDIASVNAAGEPDHGSGVDYGTDTELRVVADNAPQKLATRLVDCTRAPHPH